MTEIRHKVINVVSFAVVISLATISLQSIPAQTRMEQRGVGAREITVAKETFIDAACRPMVDCEQSPFSLQLPLVHLF